MGDLESLLLVLAAIYLSECAVWVRRGAVALHSYRGRTWHLWHPGTLLGNALGLVGCWLLSRYQFVELPKDVFYVNTLPVKTYPEYFVAVTFYLHPSLITEPRDCRNTRRSALGPSEGGPAV